MPYSKEIDRKHIEAWLSAPRYKRYLEVSRDNDEVALKLYLWNIGLAQAVLRDVSFFEVALRNAYSTELNRTWTGSGHWLFDSESPLRRPLFRKNKRGIVNDVNRLNRNAIDHLVSSLRSPANCDDIISNLSLGFWAHMTDRNHERILWIPTIHKAWPKGTQRTEINESIRMINQVRNRAAHHEHLFAKGGEHCSTLNSCREAANLFSELEPVAAAYVYKSKDNECSVDTYLQEHPAPCPVSV